MTSKEKRRLAMRVALRLLIALVVLAVGIFQALDETKLYRTSPGWRAAGLIAVGVLTFADNVRAAMRASSLIKLAEDRRKVFRYVVAAIALLASTGDTEITYVGASVFTIKKHWRRVGLRHGVVGRRASLDRWERIRLVDHPQPSKVDWTPGKGAVGEAWNTARPAHRDWTGINRRWAATPPDAAKFASMAVDTKAGLSFNEFLALLGKYSETLAVPINDSAGNVVGILSVDVACTGNVPVFLDSSGVENLLDNTVGLIRPLVFG